MSLSIRIIALVLAIAWMLATQHCGLEAAGMFSPCSAEAANGGACSPDEHCELDGCALIERGSFTPANHSIKLPPPKLLSCACVQCLQLVKALLQSQEVAPAAWLDAPQEWVSDWNFERRTASPPRAPSLIA